ncbi:lytic murein transglycosylase [Mesorhizobium sp. B2-4-12]|nr:lytic murein transglycosylase [Mesorhizobium sp. B2-4-17]TPK99632.1 lytic murein transglycosylase [Mesorhizobium sp. B2-4-12]
MMAFRPTPLWPAGHLPRKGGDRMPSQLSPIFDVQKNAPPAELAISPLAGEMSGRTEGGAWALPWQSAP